MQQPAVIEFIRPHNLMAMEFAKTAPSEIRGTDDSWMPKAPGVFLLVAVAS